MAKNKGRQITKNSGRAVGAAPERVSSVRASGHRARQGSSSSLDAPEPSEGKAQGALVKLLQNSPPDVCWFHIPNGGRRSKRQGGILKAQGTRAGAPDFVILKRNQAPLALELKKLKGAHSDAQVFIGSEWTKAGGIYIVAYGLDEAIAVVTDYVSSKPIELEKHSNDDRRSSDPSQREEQVERVAEGDGRPIEGAALKQHEDELHRGRRRSRSRIS